MNQQDFTDAFILFLSGAAEMENEKEIKWKDGSGFPITIEFINNSPTQAIVRGGGAKYWYLNGQLCREDGPACEYADGTKYWYINGQLHREDGPAVEYAGGTKSWYLNGRGLTKEEFNRRKPK